MTENAYAADVKLQALEWLLPRPGSRWIWEPDKGYAREEVTVIEVKWNGEEFWILGETSRGRFWNDLGRWIEATVLLFPPEES